MPSDYVAGTDILVVRRASECEAGVSGCAAVVNGKPYIQVSKCATETALNGYSYVLDLYGTGTFNQHVRNCTAAAGLRQYYVNIYYLSSNNGQGQSIPTLKRLEFNGTGFDSVPLVEGIEQINFEYGIDWDNDGQPNGWTADPTNTPPAGCSGACDGPTNWANVVAVRINLISRNADATPTYTDGKTYTLGLDASGNAVTYTPNDHYHRHAYSSLVRVVNVSQRRETF
jgi:type IV pilus assembly protein PilW